MTGSTIDPTSRPVTVPVGAGEDGILPEMNGTQSAPPTRDGGRKSMSALSSTLSASSSLSGSDSPAVWPPAHSQGRFKHYHRPTVLDSPALVRAVQQSIDEMDVDALAQIARNHGLPPAQRQYAWPLLLSTHPHVTHPSIVAQFPTQPVPEDEVPVRRIRNDIARYRKRLKASSTNSHGGTTHNSVSRATSTGNSPGVLTPRGGKPPTDVSERTVAECLTDSMEDRRYEIIQEAVEDFLRKWGQLVAYESPMIWVAFALAEWVDPVFEFAERDTNSNTSQSSTPELTPVGMWDADSNFSFHKVYEHLMLVIFYTPKKTSDGPSGPLDNPASDRISHFITAFRRLLPDISAHFDEEDVMSSIGGDEWLLWWVKWLGAKVFHKSNRGRMWDMYLGWRPTAESPSTVAPVQKVDIGPFWDPLHLESNALVDMYTQHIFVCLAVLKAKKNTLLELDQSEIREYLGRVSKIEDMESIVTEAGELWRSWQVTEEEEDDEI